MKTELHPLFIVLALFGGVSQSAAQGVTVFPIATNLSVFEFSSGIAFGGANYLVGMEVGTAVVGQLVSSNGTLQGSQIIVGSNPANLPPSIALAFGQTNYLMAWSDNSISSGVDMFGQFVSRNGVKVGSKFNLLSAQGSHGFQYVRALATDGTNFLAVWQETNNFYGQMVTPAGTLSGAEFLISSQHQNGRSAAVAFGRMNYLVVWQSNNNDTGDANKTYGELVSPNGSAGSPFQISASLSTDQNPLTIGFDGANYLVVWDHDEGMVSGTVTNWDIYARLVSPTGTFPGNELQLVTDLGSQIIPSLAFDGSNYLLAWGDEPLNSDGSLNTINYNIHAEFLDRSASALGSEFTIFEAQGTNTPLFAFKGLLFDGNRFAVAATLGTIARSNGHLTGFPSSEVYGAFIPTSLPATAVDQFTYTTNADNTITITGYTGSDNAVLIPSLITGLPVTSIGDSAFESTSVTSVTIAASVLNIGDDAFDGCDTLTSVTIGTNVTNIGYGAFENCPALTSITIPKGVTNIGAAPFASDGSLTGITVDALNSFYSSVGGVLFDKGQTTLIQYPEGNGATSYIIPNSVISIGADAVSGSSLTSIAIPNSVTSIGDYAFSGSASLTSIAIPNSVTNIGAAPFQACTSLTAINVDTNNPAYSSVAGVLFNHNQTTLLEYPDGNVATTYAIPNSVTSIGQSAFDSTSLTNVTIGTNVTSIGSGAFYFCTSLTSVTIARSVTSIGGLAFAYCSSLTSVYFAGNAPSTDSSAFDGFVNGHINAIVYYLPGTTGWGATFAGLPTALWTVGLDAPQLTPLNYANGHFSLLLTGTPGINYAIQASADLSANNWTAVVTNSPTNGTFNFTDTSATNRIRFYRAVKQ
ncbi:MAG: leucine-rich repeat protein [Limisphaerales bacterium]